MKKPSNALTRLGHALTRYLKTPPDNHSKPYRRNLPAVRNKHTAPSPTDINSIPTSTEPRV